MPHSGEIRFQIPGPDLSFRAKLLTDENPDVVQQVLAQLPLQSLVGHVVVSGQVIWIPTRIVHIGHSHMVQRHPGAVYFDAPRQTICLIYGRTTESGEVNKFGEVIGSDLPILQKLGEFVYEQTITHPHRNILEMNVDRIITPVTKLECNWREAKEVIEEEIDRVWLKEPEDIQKIRWSGPGTGDQSFSVLDHLEAYLMLIGADMYSLLKISQHENVELLTLEHISREFLAGTFNVFEFITDLGLTKMDHLGQMYLNALKTLTTKEEYVELTGAMMTYVSRMHRWIHHIFPWDMGVDFLHHKPGEVLSLAKEAAAASFMTTVQSRH